MIGTALSTHLNSVSAITTILGGTGKVFPVVLPQDPPMPAVTYQVLTQPTYQTHDAKSFPNTWVQIDCWSKTYLQSNQLADAIATALDGFRGQLGGTVSVSAFLLKARRDFFEGEVTEFRTSLDFSIWHQ